MFYRRFGLMLSQKKREIMVFSGNEDDKRVKSLVKLSNQ